MGKRWRIWIAAAGILAPILLSCEAHRTDRKIDAGTSGPFYVATDGNDAWSGTLPAPNAAKTNGPFATLGRARDAMRESKGQKVTHVRAGTYYLPEPVVLTPEDSGASFLAYEGERPVLSGGRPVAGWKKAADDTWTVEVPDAKAGKWTIRQLRVGAERQICARYPNFDPANPYKGGWSFVVFTGPLVGVFGSCVANIHTPGDWIEWKINAPADGDYAVWFYYGAKNQPHGRTNMAGRTTLQVDEQEPVWLENLPDTDGWAKMQWTQTARLRLTKGARKLRWTNVKGGGLNFDAFALCDDEAWRPALKPRSQDLNPPASGKHLIIVQAEQYDAAQGKEMTRSALKAPAYADHFEFRPGDIKKWPRTPDPEIHIFPAWGWVSSTLYVTSIDHDKRIVRVEQNTNASQELRVGNRYYASNVIEELDAPGEWCLDRASGVLHYRPKSPDFEKQGVVADHLDRLFDIKGEPESGKWVEGVAVKGFEMSDTTYSRVIPSVYSPQDAAVWLSGARGCVIENNRFVNIGGYAARLDNRSANNEFIGNEVAYAGQGGVVFVGEPPSQPRDNLVAGNWIHHGGQVYKHVAGVYGITAGGTRVAHNRVEHMPRYGISFKTGSHNNTIEYNDLFFTNLETNDTGAIETLGRDRQDTGNVIQYNRILDVVGLGAKPDGEFISPHYTWGIYLDDYSSGTLVRGNVAARTVLGGGHIHGGKNNVFENNVFVAGSKQQFTHSPIDDFCVNNRVVRNVFCFTDPEAALFAGRVSVKADHRVIAESDYNLFWHTQGAAFFTDKKLTPMGTLVQWQEAGYDTHSVVADPLFVDSEKDDYRLKPDSPAHNLGFKEIPWDRMGLQGYSRSWKTTGR